MDTVKLELKRKTVDRPKVYLDQLVTIEDLSQFKQQLLFEIKLLLKEHCGQPTKKWLKSNEVRKVLNISPGTLQNLRVKGILPFTRVGGVIYHDVEDIQHMLKSNKGNKD